MKGRIIGLFLTLFVVALIVVPCTVEPARAYVDPLWDPCELCTLYGVPYACQQCALTLWWEQDGCFPADPDCY